MVNLKKAKLTFLFYQTNVASAANTGRLNCHYFEK